MGDRGKTEMPRRSWKARPTSSRMICEMLEVRRWRRNCSQLANAINVWVEHEFLYLLNIVKET